MAQRRPLTDAPERLEPAARERIRDWARSHLPWGDSRVGRSWGECRDWHLSRGVLRADWEAAFRNWLRKELEIESRPRLEGVRGFRGWPQGRDPIREARGSRPNGSSLGPSRISEGMGEVISLFKGSVGGD